MSRRFLPIAISLLVVVALLALSAFGIAGLGRHGIFNFDGQVLYAAGRAWLQGANPYDFDALSRANSSVPGLDLSEVRFFYPPQASVFCVPLGLFTYEVAAQVWLLCNLTAIAVIVAVACSIVREETPSRWEAGAGIIAALIIGNPFTAHVLWMGQTALVAFAATFAAWRYYGQGKWLATGVCLGLASYKPQICMLVFLWMLLDRNWRALCLAGATAAAMSLYPILTQGPLQPLREWLAGIGGGYAMEFNLPGFSHKVGLESLLYWTGFEIPGRVFLAAGILLTVVLWCIRRRLVHTDVLALLMAVTFTFSGYLHDYDYVALVPLYVSIWRLAFMSRLLTATSVVLVLLLFVPQRIVHLLAIPMLEQWRSIVVILLAIIIVTRGMVRGGLALSLSPGPPGHA